MVKTSRVSTHFIHIYHYIAKLLFDWANAHLIWLLHLTSQFFGPFCLLMREARSFYPARRLHNSVNRPLFQVHVHWNLYVWVPCKNLRARILYRRLYVSQRPMELVGFHGHFYGVSISLLLFLCLYFFLLSFFLSPSLSIFLFIYISSFFIALYNSFLLLSLSIYFLILS